MVKITVLYDNYSDGSTLSSEWGFSCLIEGLEKTVLFDTGGKAEVLRDNFQTLGIDPLAIDCVVISHMHWDHINGLEWLVDENSGLDVLLPSSAKPDYIEQLKDKTNSVEILAGSKTICDCMFTTGTFDNNIPEQALCLDCKDGLVVITGCSHPGICEMLESIKGNFNADIDTVIGGFHLKSHRQGQVDEIISKIKSLGVRKIGPTHCTGLDAIKAFKVNWQESFIEVGVGKTLVVQI